jgi:hypothetical protein
MATNSKRLETELRKTRPDLHKQIGEQGLKLEPRGSLKEDAEMIMESEEKKATSP